MNALTRLHFLSMALNCDAGPFSASISAVLLLLLPLSPTLPLLLPLSPTLLLLFPLSPSLLLPVPAQMRIWHPCLILTSYNHRTDY